MSSKKTFPYLAILDFEATCEDRNIKSNWDTKLQEIIELPMGLISVEKREIIDTFDTFVKPTKQPRLTPFCTQLTSITQEDVEFAPTITEAMEKLQKWWDHHRIKYQNCLVVTCGDWDLKKMWPQQASLVPELSTPDLFRRWCNLKVVYSKKTKEKKKGMMGMLKSLGIEHRGRHHRGKDDVENICRLVLHLMEKGAPFPITWGEEERARERQKYAKKVKRAKKKLKKRKREMENLPGQVDDEVKVVKEEKIVEIKAEIERLEGFLEAFLDPR